MAGTRHLPFDQVRAPKPAPPEPWCARWCPRQLHHTLTSCTCGGAHRQVDHQTDEDRRG